MNRVFSQEPIELQHYGLNYQVAVYIMSGETGFANRPYIVSTDTHKIISKDVKKQVEAFLSEKVIYTTDGSCFPLHAIQRISLMHRA